MVVIDDARLGSYAPDDAALGRRSLAREQVAVLGVAERLLESHVLLGLLRLGVFDAIGSGAASAQDIAVAIGVQTDVLTRALRAGVAVRVLGAVAGPNGTLYEVLEPFASVLVRGAGPGYLGDWLVNLGHLGEAVGRLDDAVRWARPTMAPEQLLGRDADRTHAFVDGLDNYASLRGRELADYVDVAGCRSLLDVGCGSGSYAFALGAANPDMALHLLDLPGVLEVTREHAERYAPVNPLSYHPLDVELDEIPGHHDLVLVSNVLHMLGEDASRALLARLYDTVNPGGSIVVQAQFLDEDVHGARWPALLDVIQLCVTEQGRNHTVAETTRWMHEAGFERVEHCSMGLLNTNSFLRGYRA